jgi:hypothetical protein
MAEIQFERRGLPLWKVLLGLLAAGAAAVGGYEVWAHDTPAQAGAVRAQPAPAPRRRRRRRPPAAAPPAVTP